MLINQPQKWTLNGVISVGVFATLNGMTQHIFKPPKWRDKPKPYPKQSKIFWVFKMDTLYVEIVKNRPLIRKSVVDAQCPKSDPFSTFLLTRMRSSRALSLTRIRSLLSIYGCS